MEALTLEQDWPDKQAEWTAAQLSLQLSTPHYEEAVFALTMESIERILNNEWRAKGWVRFERRQSHSFEENAISICIVGLLDHNVLALLLSSENLEIDWRPIRVCFAVNSFEKWISVTDNQFVTGNQFLIYDKWTFYYVSNPEFICFNWVLPFVVDIDANQEHCYLHKNVITSAMLSWYWSSKLNFKKFLISIWVNTPQFKELPTDIRQTEVILGDFCNRYPLWLVVKWDAGYAWRQVAMFSSQEQHKAIKYAKNQILLWDKVFVEERICPLPYYDKQGRKLDWNIRVVVNIWSQVDIVDAVVRARLIEDNRPVNLSGGWMRLSLDVIEERYPWIKAQVYAICHKIWLHITRPFRWKGLIWIDIICSPEWIYVLEVNSWAIWWLWASYHYHKDTEDSPLRKLLSSWGRDSANIKKPEKSLEWQQLFFEYYFHNYIHELYSLLYNIHIIYSHWSVQFSWIYRMERFLKLYSVCKQLSTTYPQDIELQVACITSMLYLDHDIPAAIQKLKSLAAASSEQVPKIIRLLQSLEGLQDHIERKLSTSCYGLF